MSKQFKGNVEELKARIPILPVVRDMYCSQKMTDEIISNYLNAEDDIPFGIWPARNLEKALYMDNYEDLEQTSYYEVYEEFLGEISGLELTKQIDMPATLVGYNDLGFEYRRRLRTAMGHCEPFYRGEPLCENINDFPNLPVLPIEPMNRPFFTDTTQEHANWVIEEFIKDYKMECLALSESMRNKTTENYIHFVVHHEIKKMIETSEAFKGKEKLLEPEIFAIKRELCRRINSCTKN